MREPSDTEMAILRARAALDLAPTGRRKRKGFDVPARLYIGGR